MAMKKWISRIITGVFVAILIVMASFTISSKISGGTPKIFGDEVLAVLSGSMEPRIHTGSIIVIHPLTNTANLRVGDVITFHNPDDWNMLITHRIHAIVQSGSTIQFQTKGDANDAHDPKLVPVKNVVGQYVNITIPYAGYVDYFAKSKGGIVILLIIPGALLIGWQMVGLWRALLQLEREKKPISE